MSQDPKSVQSAPDMDAPRPCAFYQAAMPASPHTRRHIADSQERPPSGGLAHRCMLNPGRASGPDGEEIGPLVCTLSRQGGCQQHRRKNIARLYETLPAMRTAEAAQVSIETA